MSQRIDVRKSFEVSLKGILTLFSWEEMRLRVIMPEWSLPRSFRKFERRGKGKLRNDRRTKHKERVNRRLKA